MRKGFLFSFNILFYSKLNHTLITIPTQAFWSVNIEQQPNVHVCKTTNKQDLDEVCLFFLWKNPFFFPLFGFALTLAHSDVLVKIKSHTVSTDVHTDVHAGGLFLDCFLFSAFELWGETFMLLSPRWRTNPDRHSLNMKPLFKPLTLRKKKKM